jgi:tRNA-splicing ligase RtcB
MNGKQLLQLGIKSGPIIGKILKIFNESYMVEDESSVLSFIEKDLLINPSEYLNDETWGEIAQIFVSKNKEKEVIKLRTENVPYSVYGSENIEEEALTQMDMATKLPISVRGALMPDAHGGYGLPIGGVLATQDAIIPYGVGNDIGCFVGNVKIQLCNNTKIDFLQMIEEQKRGIEHFGFSKSFDNEIEISKLENARQTRIVDELVEITLDNNEKYRCTLDHIHYLLDGSEIEASKLKKGDSLFPLYIDYAKHIPIDKRSYRDKKNKLEEYLMVYNPSTKLYDYIHFLSDKYNIKHNIYDIEIGKNIRHHKDFNKYNNNPSNIEKLTWKEHWKKHYKMAKENCKNGIIGWGKAHKNNPEFFSKMASDNMKKLHLNPDFIKRRNKRASEIFKKYTKTKQFKEQSKKAGLRGKQYLIEKNKSINGRKKSSEIAHYKYQCPICNEIVVGGFGIRNHSTHEPCKSKLKNKKFTRIINHTIKNIKIIKSPNTPVYCLTVKGNQNFALASGIFVHNCRMHLSIYTMDEKFFKGRTEQLKDILSRETLFGTGEEFKKVQDEHEILDHENFKYIKVLRDNKDKAAKQLGTSGSGNHFVEFGLVEIFNDFEFDNHILQKGIYFGLLSHSGSRGLGNNIASYYTKIARQKCITLPKEARHLSWLDMNSEEGQEYWIAMNIAGDYARANHEIIHKKISRALGERPFCVIQNHHNFAWKEIYDGVEYIVHRKGATPAGVDNFGIIPGNMADAGYIVRGLGNTLSLNSASHGAGRVMSRAKAREKFTLTQIKNYLETKGVLLIGGDTDEGPGAYKNIEEVMNNQRDLVLPLGKFQPKIVRMNERE